MLYRCVRSGRVMEVTDPENIEQMKTNESYVVVQQQEIAKEVSAHSQGDSDGLRKKEEVTVENADAPSQVKKRGRPAKAPQAVQQPAAAEQDWV